MMNQLLQLDTDLWEAWIEFDQFSSNSFGTLYVVGEIGTGQALTKAIRGRSRNLILEISIQKPGSRRVKEVRFTESISSLNQYESIIIYSNGKLVKEFSEIEIMV